ncbi:NTP transferase domain-containing protein [Oribacterium sp. FC2011]|uniref:NTP transferase domain-containing protein n=1 Tax=Oribacterium sp. FC2011 TaxID=1408311 RepID=UPI0004E11452|nr:NTP transferase domain-containing protein [Oribacterium sp. FC2011]
MNPIVRNAVILAAGKSSRFAPFTYEKPKGLFRVKGEILIERQIEQLIEAGVNEIIVVVGYMKEKFFYLEQKYPNLHLVVNNEFGKKGNLYSVYMAREYLNNTFVCCADHYFTDNPFSYVNSENKSWRACSYEEGKFREFAVTVSDAGVITDTTIGGHDSLAQVGCAYMNESFSTRFRELMESEINDFGVASMFWEDFYGRHIRDLTFYCREFSGGTIFEFENIDDLREFDSEFLLNVDSEIIENITKTLRCDPNDINNIAVINAGLTNVSFGFDVGNTRYVYRHPGGTAGNLINRQAELFAQFTARDIGIDKSVIDMRLEGWKVSYHVHDAKNCDFEKNDNQLIRAMEMLHQLHDVQVPDSANVKVFDDVAEAKKLIEIASATKGHLAKEFKPLIDKIDRLYPAIKADAERLGYGLVLCHNDTYEPNYLYDDKDEMFLIDWEYAGLNYAVNDIGCILCRYDWTDEQIARYLRYYVGRELTKDEKRFYYGFIPISAFYWFGWGLYKGSVGDDDSFFFLPAYRNLVRFIDKALESYGV